MISAAAPTCPKIADGSARNTSGVCSSPQETATASTPRTAGGLAAACVVTRYGESHAGPELAAIGMVLVADRFARQGLGRRLMTHVCDDVLKGIPLTLHATPYGRPLYEELGFETTGRAEMLRGAFRHEIAPATHETSRIRPATAEDLPRILSLDAEVFGTDRTHMIIRLPAFADQLIVAEGPLRRRHTHRLRSGLAQHGHPGHRPADRP